MPENTEYQDDTATLDDVYQAPNDHLAVPVRITDSSVVVNQNPTQLGRCLNMVLSSSSTPVLVLNREPRRARAQLWLQAQGAGCDGVIIGPTQGQADSFTGAFLLSQSSPTVYTFTNTSELWARPCNVDTAGSFTASSSACVLSVVEELWTR